MGLMQMSTDERKKIASERYHQMLQKLESCHPKIVSDFKNVPDKYKRIYLEVHTSDKPSFPMAIKGKCLDCCCWERVEITNCTVRQCTLWKLRPYQ